MRYPSRAPSCVRFLLVACIALSCAEHLHAQLVGGSRGGPPPRARSILADDPVRGRVHLFGHGNDDGATWEWDGCHWTLRTTYPAPPDAQAVHFDEQSGRLIAFYQTQVWEWDGIDWTKKTSGNSVGLIMQHRLAYDSARKSIVACPTDCICPIYRWNGALWVPIGPSLPRIPDPYIAFDRQRNALVIFDPSLARTWEWDGQSVVDHGTSNTFPRRLGASIAFDASRRQVVLFGGRALSAPNQFLGDLWAWNGIQWTRVYDAPALARQNAGLAFDSSRGRLMLTGGSGTLRYRADTWMYSAQWSQCSPADTPPVRHGHVACFDSGRSRLVLFGGVNGNDPTKRLGDTWEWNGIYWEDRSPAVGPSARDGHQVAYDPIRRRTVLWGGIGITDKRTWEWDGSTWAAISSPNVPPTMEGHSLAWDPNTKSVLLFGGRNDSGTLLRETWSWNGQDWRSLAPALSPPPLADHGATTDPVNRVLVVGGRTIGGNSTETWSWDGSKWIRLDIASPTIAASGRVAFDAGRGRPVLWSGADFFEFTGQSWQRLTATAGPGGSGLAYDSFLRELVLLSGGSETWVWSDVVAASAPYGQSLCGGPFGKTLLAPFGLPRIGNPAFGIDLQTASPNSAGLLILSLGQADQAIGFGCKLYVDLTAFYVAVPLTTSGVGLGFVRVPVPFDANLSSVSAYGQAVLADGGPWNGLSLSHGLAVTFGH